MRLYAPTKMQNHNVNLADKERLLPSSMATVNPQIRSGHESTGIAEQEYSGATVVLRLAELVQHVVSGPLRLALGVLHKQLLNHLGDNWGKTLVLLGG